jgi:hypothetical protein
VRKVTEAPRRPSKSNTGFVLYVEGPRDRGILRAWAYRLLPRQARPLFEGAVILGGRRPQRAVEHFATSGAEGGLCVLDLDDVDAPLPAAVGSLRFFTWSRRHIESYLLVPAAIQRALGLRSDDRGLQRFFDAHVPECSDVDAWRKLDAKRLLGERGAFSKMLGGAMPLARVARATRVDELHADVRALFGHLEGELAPPGISPPRNP